MYLTLKNGYRLRNMSRDKEPHSGKKITKVDFFDGKQ